MIWRMLIAIVIITRLHQYEKKRNKWSEKLYSSNVEVQLGAGRYFFVLNCAETDSVGIRAVWSAPPVVNESDWWSRGFLDRLWAQFFWVKLTPGDKVPPLSFLYFHFFRCFSLTLANCWCLWAREVLDYERGAQCQQWSAQVTGGLGLFLDRLHCLTAFYTLKRWLVFKRKRCTFQHQNFAPQRSFTCVMNVVIEFSESKSF